MQKENRSLMSRFLIWLLIGCIGTIFVLFVGNGLFNWSYHHVIPFQKLVDKNQPVVKNELQRDEIIQRYLKLTNK